MRSLKEIPVRYTGLPIKGKASILKQIIKKNNAKDDNAVEMFQAFEEDRLKIRFVELNTRHKY